MTDLSLLKPGLGLLEACFGMRDRFRFYILYRTVFPSTFKAADQKVSRVLQRTMSIDHVIKTPNIPRTTIARSSTRNAVLFTVVDSCAWTLLPEQEEVETVLISGR